MNTPKDQQSKENEYLDTSICSVELEASVWQPSSLGEYRQLSLWKSIPMLKQSCDRTSQEFQFIPTLETTDQNQENLTLLPEEYQYNCHGTRSLHDNQKTESWEEKKDNPENPTINAKIPTISTPNQNLQPSIGSFINKDLAQQTLERLTELPGEQSTRSLNHTDTDSERKSNCHSSSLTEPSTPSSQVVITPEPIESDRYFTEMSGNTTMDKFPTDGMFTTLTKTNKTTELKTLNASPKKNTLDITPQIEKQKRSEELIQAKSMPQQGKQRKRLDAQEAQSFVLFIISYPDEWANQFKNAPCWSDQMREMVQREFDKVRK